MANDRQPVGKGQSIPAAAIGLGQPATSVLIVQRVLALVVICALGLVVQDHPIANAYLMVGLGMYAITLWFFPHAWLLMLPVLLPTLILSPWTGRLLYGEFDFFVVMTLAAGLWRGRYLVRHQPALPAIFWILLVMQLATQLHGVYNGFFPLQTFDANSLGTYYTSYNALRIGMGFFAALLLFPLLRDAVSSDRQLAGRLLAQGTMLGVVCVGLVVLWERGIIHDVLNAEDKYALFGNLLDFSSSYRITALFADMHTGGAAIDGYIAVALPICLLPLLERRNRLDR